MKSEQEEVKGGENNEMKLIQREGCRRKEEETKGMKREHRVGIGKGKVSLEGAEGPAVEKADRGT